MVPRAVLIKTGLKPFNTARTVNTAHSKSIVFSVKPMSRFSKSAQSTGHPQNEDQGYVDSGCSRHMTWNMSYVTFGDVLCSRHMIKAMLTVDAQTSWNLIEDMLPLGEEPKEGKLLMCDKKNSVLFTDTGCFVLSPDFKLADESQVLLKVPRKNNMYSVDTKNIIPK
ncbi:hypothetical protein Tco_0062884 [Tanacetum coccineum]